MLRKRLEIQAEWAKNRMRVSEYLSETLMPYASEIDNLLITCGIYCGELNFYPQEGKVSELRKLLTKIFDTNGKWNKVLNERVGEFYWLCFVEGRISGYQIELRIYDEIPKACKLISYEVTETKYKMECGDA